MKIAGNLTAASWAIRAAELRKSSTPELWRQTIQQYLDGRLHPRYLQPIGEMEKLNKFQGEGFSVVTIQCALIEFLAALREGVKYKREKPDPNNHEYSGSKRLFVKFLGTVPPFSTSIGAEAEGFYDDVRCGLLHEGQTKNRWLIKKRDGKCLATVISAGPQKTLYWSALQCEIMGYLSGYRIALENDAGLQAAFLRKYDHLAS